MDYPNNMQSNEEQQPPQQMPTRTQFRPDPFTKIFTRWESVPIITKVRWSTAQFYLIILKFNPFSTFYNNLVQQEPIVLMLGASDFTV